jgi:HEAT repeat protein
VHKRVQIALAVILAGVGLWLSWFVLRDSCQEPVYQGKKLSDWLEGCDKSHWVGTEWRESTEAVQHIGTNAIPTLLSKLRQKDSAVVMKLRSWATRQQFVRIRIRYVSAAAQNHKAAVGFEALGPAAKTAVPELIKIFEENISDDSEGETANSLGWIGPEANPAIPALLRGLTNATYYVRWQTVRALLQIHAEENPQAVLAFAKNNVEPDLVVPALAKSLSDPSALVRRTALNGLAGYRFESKPALPALVSCLNDVSSDVQEQAADILACLGTDANPATPALVRLLNSPNDEVRLHARKALQQIDPKAAARADVK